MRLASSASVAFVNTLRNIIAAGLIGFASIVTKADDGASGGDSQIRNAVSIFQDQRAEYVRRHREQRACCDGKLRAEVRDQVSAARVAPISVRRELRISIAEARAQALEQSRKLIEEGSSASRQSRRGQ